VNDDNCGFVIDGSFLIMVVYLLVWDFDFTLAAFLTTITHRFVWFLYSFINLGSYYDNLLIEFLILTIFFESLILVLGRISANFASLDRQLQNINDLVKREIMPDKRDDGMK
jgi:hypothetical protein